MQRFSIRPFLLDHPKRFNRRLCSGVIHVPNALTFVDSTPDGEGSVQRNGEVSEESNPGQNGDSESTAESHPVAPELDKDAIAGYFSTALVLNFSKTLELDQT